MASIIDDDALIDHWHLNEVRTEETVENEGESCGGTRMMQKVMTNLTLESPCAVHRCGVTF